MSISAKDKATGKLQSIKIEASSGLSEADIARMKAEAEQNAESDKKKKEEVDKLNGADALIFQTEKQLEEYGDKIPADKKAPIESALAELKTAHAAKDFAQIDVAMEKLNTVFQAASQEMYANTGGQGDAQGDPNANAGSSSTNEKKDAEAEDVDFEEVKTK